MLVSTRTYSVTEKWRIHEGFPGKLTKECLFYVNRTVKLRIIAKDLADFNIVKGIPGISVTQKVETILELILYVVRSYN